MNRLVDSIDLGYSSPMSDAAIPPKPADVHWTHYCEQPGCTAWGSFGHEIGARTVWFCKEHDPCGGKGGEGRGATTSPGSDVGPPLR